MKKQLAMVVGVVAFGFNVSAQILWANTLLSGEWPEGNVGVEIGTCGITIQGNLVGNEFLRSVFYNGIQTPHPVLTLLSKSGAFNTPDFTWDYHHVPGGLTFPFGLEFATSNSSGGVDRFDGSDAVEYGVGYPVTMVWPPSESSVLDTNSGNLSWVARVQGPHEKDSAWIGYDPTIVVPEPATYAGLFALGLAGFAAWRRLRA